MHSFSVRCNITPSMFQHLLSLPGLKKISDHVYQTNFYSKKGITQIDLHIFQYISNSGVIIEKYYLVMRCNAGAIMGENPVLALNMTQYTKDEILNGLKKRIYEINELRFLNLHQCDLVFWKADRVDITIDIFNTYPTLAVLLCSLSFPYGYRNMQPVSIKKNIYTLMAESCYFRSKSRTVNIYFKLVEINNNQKIIDTDTADLLEKMLRIEIQIEKKAIYNLMRTKTDKRSLEHFLDNQFCYDYLKKEMLSIFGAEKYVDTSTATDLIQQSIYSTYEKGVLISIIKMIHRYCGLYGLEKAIDDVNTFTPPQYGNLRQFREKWLNKIRALGISPATIPDPFGIKEFPSIPMLLMNSKTI